MTGGSRQCKADEESETLSQWKNTGVGTVVHVAVDGKYAGYILISDVIKDGAKEAIASLKNSGVKKCVMLTGDSKTVAEHVAGELKLDEVHSELLPADKVSCVEKLLQDKSEKEKLAFVGDGINDAPVLSRADIGIAMGALGSDAAIEAADVVLMDDNPAKIALAMRISRKCLRIVYENIVFALAVKAICLILGALGIANMWVAIFADVGVMVLAVLNAIRCLALKIINRILQAKYACVMRSLVFRENRWTCRLFSEITALCRNEQFLHSVMEKYHYDPEEYPNLKRLAGEMIPCLETEAGWQDREIQETFPGRDQSFLAVGITLGKGIDALQEKYLQNGFLTESYMIEVLSSELLESYPGLYRVAGCASESACCQTAFLGGGDF